jgi:hypothetical protein
MRKYLVTLIGILGLAVAFAVPASANVATGMTHKPVAAADSGVTKVRYGHHGRHGGLGFGLYFGRPSYYSYYPRYRYYNDDYNYRPRTYSYYSSSPRRHGRHWCNRHDRWEW